MSAWNFNLGGKTAEEIDKAASKPPDGFYLATLSKVEDDSETLAKKFEFKIEGGLHAGVILRGRLNNPSMADPDKAEGMIKKALIWGARLGLIPKGETKIVSIDFNRAVGGRFVVKAKTSSYKRQDGTMSDTYQEIDYAGIYPLDHADIDGPTRVSLGLPLLPGQSATETGKGKRGANGSHATTPASITAPATPNTQSADAIASSILG